MSRLTAFRLLATLLLAFLAMPAAGQQDDLLQAEEAFRFSIERSADQEIELRWEIEEGYYLYRDHLEAKDAASGVAVPLQTEPGIMETEDANFGPSEVYYLEALARLGADAPAQVAVTYQGCKKDSICYPPLTLTVDTASLQVSEPIVGFGVAAPSAAPTGGTGNGGFSLAAETLGGGMVGSLLASGGAIWVVVSFLAFGLLLAFTPCVLPMYPILSATLAREGEALTARRGFVLSLAYVLAMAAAFGLLGIVAAWSGQNLQMVLQSPWAIGAVAVVFVVLATSMFGMFELQLPTAWVSRMAGVQAGSRGSVGGAAGMGFLSALIVGPCVTAPLAAALLYIAQTGDAYLGAAALFALGLGQGIPLIAFGTMGSRALPRAGAWMVQVKYAFGFVFLGASIWMVSRILPPQATLALWAGFLLTAAVFLGAVDRLTAEAGAGLRFRKATGLAASLAGVILAIGAASGGTDPFRPLAHFGLGGSSQQAAATEMTFVAANSTPELEQAMASADGRPTFVYFTAEWCMICKTIERDLFPSADVVAGLDGFQRIKVDLTDFNQANHGLMRDLAVVGPPTMIFSTRMRPSRSEPV
ncbi:protein-disulfide reductase DsbD [Neoaquamicrobium sediminum]|uniref:protein-disulfide reductase DsbD n=1 Tax=Neoaquamicrobium sediminum TaxID=1849104 RepID=UPI001FD16E36|nr:protein-disulfide reductase DsbD [Mesorhizobium sediminum]